MFIDYYIILDIHFGASQDEIRGAFKKQAIKWHPDRNPGIDTTEKMQDINEAYLILKDKEARYRYDKEYKRFMSQSMKYDKEILIDDFKIQDEILLRWILNAKRQAVDLAKQTIKEMKVLAREGVRESGKEMGSWIVSYIILGIIFLLLFSIGRGCD